MGHSDLVLESLANGGAAGRDGRVGPDPGEVDKGVQAAYALARQSCASPPCFDTRDLSVLMDRQGPTRGVEVVWCLCRAHYITRVAAAFRLTPNDQHVFVDAPWVRALAEDQG
jgi:hypothetical protein